MRTTVRGTHATAWFGCLLALTACSDARVAPTTPADPRPSALIAGEGDQPSIHNPGYIADLAVATALTVPLSRPVWDTATQRWITALHTGAPAEMVHVEAGYNAAGAARVLISGSGGADGEALPVAGLLRATLMEQQDEAGIVRASGEPGAILGTSSPTEWFASHPMMASTSERSVRTIAPPSTALLGGVVLSDSAWGAARSNQSASVHAEDGGDRRIIERRIGAMRARSTYAIVRGVRSGEPRWVLANVRLQLERGQPGTATADVEIRRLTVRTGRSASGRSVATEEYLVGDVTPMRIIPPEDDPPPPPPPPPPPSGEPSAPTPPSWPGGVAPVIFQHGFRSTGSVWAQMRDRLRPALSMRDTAWTIETPGIALGAAAQEFGTRAAAFSSTPVAVVAHSAGGIIARDAARQQPGSVAGLVTIGTPHTGALIAERGDVAAIAMGGTIITEAFAVSPCVREAVLRAGTTTCEALGFLGIIGGSALVSLGVAGSDVLPRDDLKPGSAFLNTLAATPESYLRVGITHRAPRR